MKKAQWGRLGDSNHIVSLLPGSHVENFTLLHCFKLTSLPLKIFFKKGLQRSLSLTQGKLPENIPHAKAALLIPELSDSS